MGRLTLNILLSFAQFEREVIGERIRDKFAASRKRGIWMGGWAPLGYDVRRPQAGHRRGRGRARPGDLPALRPAEVGDAAGARARRGRRAQQVRPAARQGHPLRLLNNRVYIGEAVHKGTPIPASTSRSSIASSGTGACDPQGEPAQARRRHARAQTPALLKGLLSVPMAPRCRRRTPASDGRLYRYYISQTALKQGQTDCPMPIVPAGEIETIVLDQIRAPPADPGDRRADMASAAQAATRTSPRPTSAMPSSASTSSGASSSRPSRRASSQLLVARVDLTLDALRDHTEG